MYCPKCKVNVKVKTVKYADGDKDHFCAICGRPLMYERDGKVYEQVYEE